jgi:eukaryotic-like serine/threonine-protein kinase
VGGRFRLIEPVGAGGPGGVWRAADGTTGHEVAVKALAAHASGDTVAQARFRLVARTVVQLSDPGIAQVREFGEADLPDGRTVPYLVRDLIPGRTLGERLRAAPLSAGEALRVVAATADALAVAHRAGIAHGHLVPANIILAPDGVRVTDFGLWALRPRPDEDRAPGALSYAAPELAEGGPATPAADMYALGVVFLACLAGIGPGGLTPVQISPLDAPADLAGGAADHAAIEDQALDMVPPSLAALWAACLGPNPVERPSAAHAAVMSRQALSSAHVAPTWSTVAADQPALAPKGHPDWTVKREWGGGRGGTSEEGREPRRRGRAADWTEEGGSEERATERRGKLGAVQGEGEVGGAPGGARRHRLVAVGGVATVGTAAAAVVAVLLATSPGTRPASPASSTTAAQPSHPAVAGPSPAGTGRAGPTPESTSPVLATTTPTAKRIPLSPLAAIYQLSRTIAADVSSGQVRQDVGVDMDNLIQPVRTELAAGQPAPVAQLATALRQKLWTRVSEGAVTVSAATVLNDEITALARSAAR